MLVDLPANNTKKQQIKLKVSCKVELEGAGMGPTNQPQHML